MIVASSISVINACVYATGGVSELERAWGELRSLPLLLTPSLRDNPIFGTSLLSSRGLTRALERYMDFTKILESPIDLRFILLNLSRGRGELWGPSDCENRHEVRSVVRAGYAIPFLLPPVRFRHAGSTGFYFNWLRPALFAGAIRTDPDDDAFTRTLGTVGAQLDLRVVFFSNLQTILSVGYGRSYEDGGGESDEVMVSLKIL